MPGVYRMRAADGVTVYVGKAKNLRRRLGQYKNAKRIKAHRKMREIIAHADCIEWENCTSELEASLLETRLIQELRPKFNVVGAFSFLYPMVGLRFEGAAGFWCLTTRPEDFPQFGFHGAFRSRGLTGDAFFALMRLLAVVHHPLKQTEYSELIGRKYSRVFGFRQVPAQWAGRWDRFYRGDGFEALEELSMALLENAGARARASIIEEDLRLIRRFYRHEAITLKRVREGVGLSDYPVSQQQRDLLFIRFRGGSCCL